MEKSNIITASIGNPYIKDESEAEKYRILREWLDSYTQCFEIYLQPDRLVLRNYGTRTFRYPAKVTLEWIQSKVKYMVENEI